MNSSRIAKVLALTISLLSITELVWQTNALAWDSTNWKSLGLIYPTHSYLTEWAIDQLKAQYPEIQQYRAQIVEGANTELHELPVSGTKYGIDLNAKRIQHLGTNEGSNDTQGWWQDSLSAYKQGNKQQAYFVLGIMLHMVEDMGVPAHANNVSHQGTLTEFDNFEYMGLSNWKPSYANINQVDPGFVEPWKYYNFSQSWTKADAPNYNSPNTFSKTWTFASSAERTLLSNRQGRTSNVVKWAINSAVKGFGL